MKWQCRFINDNNLWWGYRLWGGYACLGVFGGRESMGNLCIIPQFSKCTFKPKTAIIK